MVCKNRGIHGFMGPSWVLIIYNICPPVIVYYTMVKCDKRLTVRANNTRQDGGRSYGAETRRKPGKLKRLKHSTVK